MSFAFVVMLAALSQTSEAPAPRVVTVTPNSSSSIAVPGALPDPARPGDRLICRTESVVGSNRRRRVCMTEAQRNAIREQSRDLRDNMNLVPAEPLPSPSGG